MKRKTFKNKKWLRAPCFRFHDLGFTLVEVLVYTAVVGTLVTAISALVLGAASNYRLAKTRDELALTADAVMRTMFQEIKNADEVYMPTSVLDSDLGQLVLKSSFLFGDELSSAGFVTFYVSQGRVTIKREGETPLALSPETLEATQLKFTRVTAGSGREGVRFYLAFKDKARPDETISLTSFAVLRGSYAQ